MRTSVVLLLFLAASAFPAETPPKAVFHRLDGGFRVPRPSDGAVGVPVGTSIFFGLEGESLDPASVSASLSDGGPAVPMLEKGAFAKGFSGTVLPHLRWLSQNGIAFRVQPTAALKPGTRYTVKLSGLVEASWSFTTAPDGFDRSVDWTLDLAKAAPVDWQGQLWGGVVGSSYDTTELYHQGESYDLMHAVRKRSRSPVWSWFRPWPGTGDFFAGPFDGNPNLVRERETRRVAKVADSDKETRLTVEDTFEHALYGVPDNRPLGGDYHPGDEVLIADRDVSERARVVAVDEKARTVTVSRLKRAAGEWLVDPPDAVPPASPDMPGRFTHPMCYLRKFAPCGTPVYYWDRLDHLLDGLVKRDGFRIVFNVTGTPCDLSVDGLPEHGGGNESPNHPKDWAEYWEFVHALTAHTAARHGKAAQDFCYSVGSEFDIHNVFWRGTEEEIFSFYDYTVDAMLKALEEAGLDSSKTPVGGLEWSLILSYMGGVTRFAEHCSPRGKGTPNYAWADPRLKGKHAKRVEDLCKTHDGKGSPCDFLSIHTYHHAAEAARRLIEAKRLALEVDPEYFKDVQIRADESCPDWSPCGDLAQKTAYRDTGYFPAWCADVAQRLVEKGAQDPRYARVETMLTIWPSEHNGFGMNDMVTLFRTGGGKLETVPLPIFHFHTLLGRMSHRYVPLPAQEIQGARVSGFASIDPDGVRLMLSAIHIEDTECAGTWEYRVKLKLSGLQGKASQVTEWRIDRDHATLRVSAQGVPGIGDQAARFEPEVVARIKEGSDLKPASPTRILSHPDGTVEIEVPVGENGIALVEMVRNP